MENILTIQMPLIIPAVFSYRTCVYVYVYEVAMQTNARSLAAMIMT